MAVSPVPMGVDDGSGNVVLMKGTPSGAPVATGVSGAMTDRSGTIATGGTRQSVMGANTARQYLFFENVSDTDMWINFGVNAVAGQPSMLIKANGGNFVMEGNFIDNRAVDVMCATTGKAYTAKEA